MRNRVADAQETQKPAGAGSLGPSDVLIALPAVAAALLLMALAVAFAGKFQLAGLTAVLLPLAAGTTGIIALLRPRWIFLGYISLCMIFPHELEEIFVPLGFMKLYPQDILFAYLIIVCLLRAISHKTSLHSIRYNKLMAVYFLLGIWAAAVGLFVTHNDYNNVFGDFRRSFFYFLSYFFVLLMVDKPNDTAYFKLALLAGAIGVIIKGFLLFGLGDFVTRRFGDAAHIMTHFEVTFATLAIFAGLTKLTLGTRHPFMWITLALCGLLIVALGNFRTCWVGLIGGLSVLLYFLPGRQRRRLTLVLAVFAGLGAITLAAMWDVPVDVNKSTVGQNIKDKADLEQAEYDPNVTWRMDSYENAFELWQTQPIIGRGLGEELEFATVTSTGAPTMAIGHRVHNSYLWFFMSLGITGFLVLVYIQWRFIKIVARAIRNDQLPKHARATLIVGASFYATIMVCACFDVYLESPPPITMISVTMAVCLLTIRYDNQIRKSGSEVPA